MLYFLKTAPQKLERDVSQREMLQSRGFISSFLLHPIWFIRDTAQYANLNQWIACSHPWCRRAWCGPSRGCWAPRWWSSPGRRRRERWGTWASPPRGWSGCRRAAGGRVTIQWWCEISRQGSKWIPGATELKRFSWQYSSLWLEWLLGPCKDPRRTETSKGWPKCLKVKSY